MGDLIRCCSEIEHIEGCPCQREIAELESQLAETEAKLAEAETLIRAHHGICENCTAYIDGVVL